jgi:hypothetical protein
MNEKKIQFLHKNYFPNKKTVIYKWIFQFLKYQTIKNVYHLNCYDICDHIYGTDDFINLAFLDDDSAVIFFFGKI